MSGELRTGSSTGLNIYGQILSPSAKRWNNSTLIFETYTVGNYANYAITLTEQGASSVYVGDFPAGITAAGEYEIFYYRRVGGSPAQGDPLIGTGSVVWNGSSAVSSAIPNALSGSQFHDYVLRIFKRTDKDTELYEEIGETIREIRRRFNLSRDEQEQTTSDTITVLGDYRIDTEADLSFFVSDVVVLDSTNSWKLTRISKSEFDYIYPNPTAISVVKNKPIHYCVFADQIYLGPVPDKTSYQYKVSLSIDDFALITSITTAVPYTNDHKNMLRAGVLKRLFESVEEYDTANYWSSQFENLFAQLEAGEDANRNAVRNVKYNDF